MNRWYFNIFSEWKSKLIALGVSIFLFIYCEVALHLSVYLSADIKIVYPILFSFIAGSLLWLISSLCPEKINRIIAIAFICITVLYYETQLVYHCIFKSFMPFSQILMGADAVTNFFSQTVYAVIDNIISVLILFIPIPLAIFLICKKKINFKRITLPQIPIALLITLVFSLLVFTVLYFTNSNAASAYTVLTNPNASTDLCIKTNGVAATTVQEIYGMLFPNDSKNEFLKTSLDKFNTEGKELNDNGAKFSNDELSKYLSTISATDKNEYTGIAKDYNLITICAEAFSPLIINQELTPTLYKLSNEGIVFNNFYNSFPNTTTNGEYTFCTGLFPDTSRNKVKNSFAESSSKYLPYCLGNIYSQQGLDAYAYHNYYGTFYNRHITHENMGYDFKAVLYGLDMIAGNPSSDLEMMEKSIPDYINSTEPFHAYYMTYSGHYQYNWDNEMAAKNREKVENTNYSEELKAYIACQLELEYALEYLIDELEKAGKADNTVIVLTSDHYPYGLTGVTYNELAGEKVDTDFEKYRNSFICYIPGIDRVEVNAPCSTQDILPTILNIMDMEFDSRLLPGKDVLSSAPHVAVLANRSFIAEDFRYNAETGEVISHTDVEIPSETVTDYQNYVSNMFTLSNLIIDRDYYSLVIEHDKKESDKVVYKFEDYDKNDVYIESTLTFMVQNGFMEPKSETEFGVLDTETAKSFINILYKMLSSQKGFKNAEEWAITKNILTKDELTNNAPLTYEKTALIIYNCSGKEEMPDEAELESLQNQYPEIASQSLVAMHWCNKNGIIMGTLENSIYELYNSEVNRYQIAAFSQRLYMYGML